MPKVEFQRCVVVDGRAYATIADAQKAIIEALFDSATGWTYDAISSKIIAERDQILAALTLKDDSRPTARKAFGATKKSRKSKTSELPDVEPKAA